MLPFKTEQLSKFLISGSWLERQQNTILSAGIIIATANLFSLIAGVLRDRVLLGQYYGPGVAGELYTAFQLAFQVPDTMYQLIVLGALSAAFIPIFTETRKKFSEKEAFQLTSIVMTLLLLAFIALGVIVFIFSDQITMLRTGSEFTPLQIKVASDLTKIMILAQVLFAISNFYTGILQSYQRFIVPAVSPLFYNLGIILGSYIFYDRFGIYGAGIGVLIGAFLHMILQFPLVYKLGFRYSFSLNYKFPGVKKMFSLMPARVLTYSLTEIQNLALGYFATSIGSLSFMIIKLGLRLMTMPIRLFGVSIGQASLPFLSEESGMKDTKKFRVLVVQSLNQITFFALPASILLLILRVPIVRLAYGAKNLDWTSTLSIGRVVAILAVSVAAQALVQLLIRAFHALKDTKTPFFVTVIVVCLYLIIANYFVFFTDLGILGLAVSTATVALVELALFLILLHKKVNGLFDRSFIIPQAKMLISSFLMAVFLYLPFRVLDELVFNTSKSIELLALTIVTSTIGFLVYIYFSALLQVRELALISGLAKHFSFWRTGLDKTQEFVYEPSLEDRDLQL
ncbi:MAG: murein biosynthesis integral membrane protein MurJ [Pseudomonadales bacterium]|nr:murein biosynthesis integral membrane protein MurJ [Pseudomonadales bacterium]